MDKPPRHRTSDGNNTITTREAFMFNALRAALCMTMAAVAASLATPASSQQAITLHGAVQFNDDHAFNKSLLKFEELVKAYYGKPINFVLHSNSELGLETDYVA